MSTINLREPIAALFDTVAQNIAEGLQKTTGCNKSSQLRRFYDQVIRFADAHRPSTGSGADERFRQALPFIRMICAHAAYAQTRKHVDANFVAFLQSGLRKVETPADLQMFRSLFEAVIGFMPKRD